MNCIVPCKVRCPSAGIEGRMEFTLDTDSSEACIAEALRRLSQLSPPYELVDLTIIPRPEAVGE